MKSNTQSKEILRRWFAGLGSSARMKYSQALRLFTTWVTGATDPQPEDALRLLVDAGRVGARQLAIGWRDSLLAAGKASGTVAGLVSALASLVTAARLCGLIEWHLDRIAPRIEPRHDWAAPPRGDMERLMAYLDRVASKGDVRAVRDVAIVRLLHNCAIDRGAVEALRMQDIDLHHTAGPRVLLLQKKSARRQAKQISMNTAESLAAWFRVRGDHAGPVFHRLQGAPRPEDATALSGEALRQMLRQRAREAGCRGKLCPSDPSKVAIKEAKAMADQFLRDACEL
jgi:integrase